MPFPVPKSFTTNGWIRWRNEQWRLFRERRWRSIFRWKHGKATMRYFHKCRNDNTVVSFHVISGAEDPTQWVGTELPDGTIQKWPSHFEGDVLVFTRPDGYDEGPVIWYHDKRVGFAPYCPEMSCLVSFPEFSIGGGNACH